MSPGSLTRLTDSTGGEVLDVLGPTVEFLTGSPDQSGPLCLMRGVVPPG